MRKDDKSVCRHHDKVFQRIGTTMLLIYPSQSNKPYEDHGFIEAKLKLLKEFLITEFEMKIKVSPTKCY